MDDNKKNPFETVIYIEKPIKKYTPEELEAKKRAERKEAEKKARQFKDKYLEYYDDIKQPEKPSW